MTDHKSKLRPVAKLLKVPVEDLERFGESALQLFTEDDVDARPEDERFPKLPDGGVEWPIALFAVACNITHQRANQLAEEGVVVRTRHGHCNASASFNRWLAFEFEARRRSRRNARLVGTRDARYWEAQGRNARLCEGFSVGEARHIASLVWETLDTLRNQHEAAPPPAKKSLETVAVRLGVLVAAMNKAFRAADEHEQYMQNQGALDFSGLFQKSHSG